MTELEKDLRSGKGMSLDIVSSPYILPAALHSSRESFHSLSKQDAHDPYRPVAFIKDETASLRRIRGDNASVYTGSSTNTDRQDANLLHNAQSMSRSHPPRGESIMPPESRVSSRASTMSPSPESSHVNSMSTAPTSASQSNPASATTSQTSSLAPAESNKERDSYFAKNAKDMRHSNKYLAALIQDRPVSGESTTRSPTSDAAPALPAIELEAPDERAELDAAPPSSQLYRRRSMEAIIHDVNHQRFASEASDYGDTFKITPPSPRPPTEAHPARTASLSSNAPIPVSSEVDTTLAPVHEYDQEGPYDTRRLSILRPLPPEDVSENPEERANRIRSFYKEYFDESKPDPEGRYHNQPHFNQTGTNDYYEDYGSEFLNEGTVYDPNTGAFVVAGARPFADPITRRAMTPPPRAPPRFRGAPPPPRGQSRRQPSASSGYSAPAPRGHTSMGGPRKPPAPPPAPLTSLPTPHLLKEDSMVFNPIDFAPPSTFRDRQAGRRPDSPMGIKRPYSPAVRAHTPLASSFDDLAVMPSPYVIPTKYCLFLLTRKYRHHLRKSGTFTALDFAPPRRFRDADTASDAGSIRSNRSNMSSAQLGALRAGAYRVSRIPRDIVGTRDDVANSLRPTWDQRGVSPTTILNKRT